MVNLDPASRAVLDKSFAVSLSDTSRAIVYIQDKDRSRETDTSNTSSLRYTEQGPLGRSAAFQSYTRMMRQQEQRQGRDMAYTRGNRVCQRRILGDTIDKGTKKSGSSQGHFCNSVGACVCVFQGRLSQLFDMLLLVSFWVKH